MILCGDDKTEDGCVALLPLFSVIVFFFFGKDYNDYKLKYGIRKKKKIRTKIKKVRLRPPTIFSLFCPALIHIATDHSPSIVRNTEKKNNGTVNNIDMDSNTLVDTLITFSNVLLCGKLFNIDGSTESPYAA